MSYVKTIASFAFLDTLALSLNESTPRGVIGESHTNAFRKNPIC